MPVGTADRDAGDLDRPADAGGEVARLLVQQPQHRTPDGAAAQQTDSDRRGGRVVLTTHLGIHSHSMVPGGLEVMSYTTRLKPRTSLMMRLFILPKHA